MLLALLLLIAPVAQTAPAPQTYRVEIHPRFDPAGFAGELKLWVSSNGYVNGLYRPDTGGGLANVRGARQGTHMWLDIPALGRLHVEATVDQYGAITGMGSFAGRSEIYIFTAKPEERATPGSRT